MLLSKTKQTLAKDATLTAFEDIIMDVFKVCLLLLPARAIVVSREKKYSSIRPRREMSGTPRMKGSISLRGAF